MKADLILSSLFRACISGAVAGAVTYFFVGQPEAKRVANLPEASSSQLENQNPCRGPLTALVGIRTTGFVSVETSDGERKFNCG